MKAREISAGQQEGLLPCQMAKPGAIRGPGESTGQERTPVTASRQVLKVSALLSPCPRVCSAPDGHVASQWPQATSAKTAGEAGGPWVGRLDGMTP